MNRKEAAVLLAKITAFDRRTTGEADDVAWSEVLTAANIRLTDALAAVTAHFVESSAWLMPADIVKIVRARRRRVLSESGSLDHPQLPWDETRAWVRTVNDLLCDGVDREEAHRQADRVHGATRPREIEPPRRQMMIDQS